MDQNIVYTADGLVERVSTPGEGTTAIVYDPSTRLPRSVVSNTGTVTTAAERDPVTDALRVLKTERGGLPQLQMAEFDNRERLATAWTNLGLASSTSPNTRLTYRYADGRANMPGLVLRETLTRVAASGPTWAHGADFVSAAGRPVASAVQAAEGWLVTALERADRVDGTTTHLRRGPLAGAPESVTLDALDADATALSTVTTTFVGFPSNATQVYHAGVSKAVTATTSLSATVDTASVENGLYTTQSCADATLRPRKIVDANGATWSFGYDALGRLRRVETPTADRHRVDYDAYCRVSVVERTGVARVESIYDSITGRLQQKRYVAPTTAVLVRATDYAYDHAGRVVRESHRDAGGAVETFTFLYDGATPADPGRRDRVGLLTGVLGPGFSKVFGYRADGSPASSTLTVNGFGSVTKSLTYDEDNVVHAQTTTVTGAAGEPVSSVTQEATRDKFGRAVSMAIQGQELAAFGFTRGGLLDWATFGEAHANREVVSFQRDALTGVPTGLNVSTLSWNSDSSLAYNNRGLIAREIFDVGTTRRERAYGYWHGTGHSWPPWLRLRTAARSPSRRQQRRKGCLLDARNCSPRWGVCNCLSVLI